MKRILSIVLMVAMFMVNVSPTLQVYADESKILTLGANLSEEQKQLVINYLGVDINNVVVIEVNNEDEHALLDGIATQQQIGTRTFSCCYIEPTSFGGIHIKTVNLSWVTCEMIRNALVTSGITNCNVICMSPIEVSGTGALTGIFKAYENVSGTQLTEEAKELATEELITTCTIAGTVGQEEASSMVSELKEEIITSELNTEEQIQQAVENYMETHSITLTEEDMWKLVELLVKLSKQDYDIEEIKQAYADIKQTASEVKEATEKTVGFFESIWNWLKGAWNWLTGKAKEIEESEQLQNIKDSMGILAQTNDSLLGDNTIVTNTIDEEVLEEISEASESEDSNSSEEKKPWYRFLIDLFNKDDSTENEEVEPTDESESSEVNFDSFIEDAEEYQEELNTIDDTDTSEDESGLLQYIKGDFEDTPDDSQDNDAEQEDADGSSIKSFDDLTN